MRKWLVVGVVVGTLGIFTLATALAGDQTRTRSRKQDRRKDKSCQTDLLRWGPPVPDLASAPSLVPGFWLAGRGGGGAGGGGGEGAGGAGGGDAAGGAGGPGGSGGTGGASDRGDRDQDRDRDGDQDGTPDQDRLQDRTRDHLQDGSCQS